MMIIRQITEGSHYAHQQSNISLGSSDRQVIGCTPN